jgi:2-polyprenyl-6-methoxyphenol hydroxylase-like FAD-dependent oxidoreductase
MVEWSLTGDAAFCPSLLAGEGASLPMAAAHLLAAELKKRWRPGPRRSRIRAQIQTLHRRQAELCGTIRYVVCAEDPVWHSCAKFRDQVDLITAACKVDDEPYYFRSIFPRSRRARARPR